MSRLATLVPTLTRALSRYVQGDGDASGFVRMADAHRGGTRGVLCLHGFTGTPFEVRPLAEALHGAGFSVSVPVLAGHARTPRDMAATRWPDWFASAEAALDDLKKRLFELGPTPRIAVAGFSMGGLLALRLARVRSGDVAAVAAMSAPLRLRERETRLIRALAWLPDAIRRGPLSMVPKRDGPDTSDPEMRKRNPGLPVMPLVSLASLLDLGELVRRDLPYVTTPTLVAHGRQDHTVPFDDALEIAGSLGSDVVERVWLDRSYHLVGIDVERRELGSALARFFTKQLGPAPSPSRADASPA